MARFNNVLNQILLTRRNARKIYQQTQNEDIPMRIRNLACNRSQCIFWIRCLIVAFREECFQYNETGLSDILEMNVVHILCIYK